MGTTKQTTAALVRQAFQSVPDGAMYYVSSVKTPAGGGTTEGARDRVNEIARELRAALKDRRVTNLTVFVLYDGEEGGEGRREEQAILPIGGAA